jgi:asparagine synthetase A
MIGCVFVAVVASCISSNIVCHDMSDIPSIKKNLERFSSNTRYSLYQIMEAQRNLQDVMEQRGSTGSIRQQLDDLKSVVGDQTKEIATLKSSLRKLSSKRLSNDPFH